LVPLSLASRHGNIADEHLPVSAMTKADSNNIMTTSKHMQPVAFLLPTWGTSQLASD